MVAPDEPVDILGPPPRFVSRGGDKLDAALDAFAVDVEGRRVLDAGASTGGFTDCVLQRGAAGVVAVDVGYGQLHERLRRDPRVHVLEKTNVRHVTVDDVQGAVDVVVADLSFISLKTVIPALLGICRAARRPRAAREAAVRGRTGRGGAGQGRHHRSGHMGSGARRGARRARRPRGRQ